MQISQITGPCWEVEEVVVAYVDQENLGAEVAVGSPL